MSKVKKVMKKNLVIIPIFIVIILVAYIGKPFINGLLAEKDNVDPQEREDIEIPGSIDISATDIGAEDGSVYVETPQQIETDSEEDNLDIEPSQEEPVSLEPLPLCDRYAETGTQVTFRCYYPNAVAYRWEYYDSNSKSWNDLEIRSGYDDLRREISYICVDASEDNSGTAFRCQISFDDVPAIIETAYLYVFDKSIVDIASADISMEAERYVDINMFPVTVVFSDGSEECITGLSGLHYLEATEEEIDENISSSGRRTKTVMVTITECDYIYPDLGKNEVSLCYRPIGSAEAAAIEFTTLLTGIDENPPEISQVDFNYEISTVDEAVPVRITITAEDDITPYQSLQYAVLPEGQEITENDWVGRSSFVKDIAQNGTWLIYCRDLSGNISIYEKDIIVIDNESPSIHSVTLAKEGWQSANTIYVEASDALSLMYAYSCAETGEDSGFISRNEYEITNNGVWTVRVKDAVGNMSSEEIYVSNIDVQSPIIVSITQKED